MARLNQATARSEARARIIQIARSGRAMTREEGSRRVSVERRAAPDQAGKAEAA
jgi:hypothetical protein